MALRVAAVLPLYEEGPAAADLVRRMPAEIRWTFAAGALLLALKPHLS